MSPANRKRIWIGAAVLIVVGAGLWWLLSGEYVDESVPWPNNPALTTERFHMAGRWLAANGFDTESLTHLQDLDLLPAAGSLLIVHEDLGRQSEIEAFQLEDWLDRGGHVLVAAPLSTGLSERAALNPYRIYRCPFCLLGPAEDGDLADNADEEDVARRDRYQRWVSEDFELELRGFATLEADHWPAEVQRFFNDSDRVIFARYRHGNGQVTLMSGRDWLSNWELLDADHAAILLALVERDSGRVYLQQRAGGGGLIGWLWRQAPLLWSLAALLLAVWIWSKLVRLGPTIEEDAGHARQFREQLLASAHFDWRHNRGRHLLMALREAQRDRLLRRYPDWIQLDRDARLKHLLRLCPDLAADTVTWFMDLKTLEHHRQLAEFIRIHQRLMHAL